MGVSIESGLIRIFGNLSPHSKISDREVLSAQFFEKLREDNWHNQDHWWIRGLIRDNSIHQLIQVIVALNQGKPPLNEETIKVLCQINKDSISELLSALYDEDPSVSALAARVLGRIGDIRAIPAILDTAKKRTNFFGNWRDLEGWETILRPAYFEALLRLEKNALIPHLFDALKGEYSMMVRGFAADLLGKIGYSRAVPALVEVLRHDEDAEVIVKAARALGRIKDPQAIPALMEVLLTEENQGWVHKELSLMAIYKALSMIQPIFQKIPMAEAKALLSFHPDWSRTPPPQSEINVLRQAIRWLPPSGSKIPRVIHSSGGERHNPPTFTPSYTSEEQTQRIFSLYRRGELGQAYVHQITVQGRLSDEFKYVALALILASPFPHDWTETFFNTSWGEVAPLVHDGGSVNVKFNPLWKHVDGRTDFLEWVYVWEPTMQELEIQGSSLEELLARVHNRLERFGRGISEVASRDYLQLKERVYQRLALAFHVDQGTAPHEIPVAIGVRLKRQWRTFKSKVDQLLEDYGIQGAAHEQWFLETPRQLSGWPGPRHEADWPLIQKELVQLENVRQQHPELRQSARKLLERITNSIDYTLGLRDQPPEMEELEPPSGVGRISEEPQIVEEIRTENLLEIAL